jgi:dimethylargininase
VGLSARTSAAGVAFLDEVLRRRGGRAVGVPMPPRVLHLKSVCSPLGDDRVLVAEGLLPAGLFGASAVVELVPELAGANAVAWNGGGVVAADAPRTQEAVTRAGWKVVPVDTSELRKADGALTCLSVIFG